MEGRLRSASTFTDSTNFRKKKKRFGIYRLHSMHKKESVSEPCLSSVEYLRGEIPVAFANASKKKVKPFKSKTVILSNVGLELQSDDGSEIIPLHSICMLREDLHVQTSLRLSSKEGQENTMFLCTRELTRYWFQFESKLTMYNWLVSIDGLLWSTFKSSLLEPNQKSGYLNELHVKNYIGGSLKVGDFEEWTYLAETGELCCVMSQTEELVTFVFSFDGQYFRPVNHQSNAYGLWDGLNLFWFSDSDVQDYSKKNPPPASSYQWVELAEEFQPMKDLSLQDSNSPDTPLTWKWARHFLSPKNHGHSAVWISREGNISSAVAMFLCLARQSNFPY